MCPTFCVHHFEELVYKISVRLKVEKLGTNRNKFLRSLKGENIKLEQKSTDNRKACKYPILNVTFNYVPFHLNSPSTKFPEIDWINGEFRSENN